MEAKHNESTEQRPEGGRIMDATLVSMDIPDFEFSSRLLKQIIFRANNRKK